MTAPSLVERVAKAHFESRYRLTKWVELDAEQQKREIDATLSAISALLEAMIKEVLDLDEIETTAEHNYAISSECVLALIARIRELEEALNGRK